MTSDLANIFLATMARIESQVPEIKHIAQDLGQLMKYDGRPDVKWPCVLLDFPDVATTNMAELSQEGIIQVDVLLGFQAVLPTSNHMKTVSLERSLAFYELEQKVHLALHGWAPIENSGYFIRSGMSTVKTPLPIRLRRIRYQCHLEDFSTTPVRTVHEIDEVEITGEILD